MAIDPSSSKSNLSATGKKGKNIKIPKSKNTQENDQPKEVAKRKKCPGIRVVGGRIYDSENGKTCHQCRQKTTDFFALCKNQTNTKACTLAFCHKCLLNRYGENAEEVSTMEDWSCPKCKDICNCSFCMKKRGHQPTGILAHTAKASGYSSVSEMLQVNGSKNCNHEKLVEDMNSSPKKRAALEMDAVTCSPRKLGKENSFNGKIDSNSGSVSPSGSSVMKKAKKAKLEGSSKKNIDNLATEADANTSVKRSILEGQVKQDTGNPSLDPAVFSDEKKLKNPKKGKLKGIVDDTFVRRTSPRKLTQSKETFNINATCDAKGNALSESRILEGKESKPIGNPEQNHDKKKLQNLKKDALDHVNDGTLARRTSPRKLMQLNEAVKMGYSGLNASLPGREPFKANSLFPSETENMTKLDDHGTQPRATGESMDINKEQRVHCSRVDVDSKFPKGIEMTSIVGVDILPEDIGKALQFIEFCAVFGKILDVKKGQAECVLKDLLHGRTSRRGKYSATVQFHIHLITIIQEEREGSVDISSSNGKQLWIQALKECISESGSVLRSLALDHMCKKADGYENLKSSEKLQILNVLCDEVLGTAKIRNWIDDQIMKHSEKAKEQKEKVVGAKNKEKSLKQKVQDEIAKSIIEKKGSFLSVSEQEAIISQIKCEAAQAHSELLESEGMLSKTKEAPDAVRIQSVYVGTDGRVYWRLKSLSNKSDLVVQDAGGDSISMCHEKWCSFSEEEKGKIQSSINVLRSNMLRAQKIRKRNRCHINELAPKP